jgi:hypothetical protein
MLKLIMKNLPHVNRSILHGIADPAYVVPDIVHYFWFPEESNMKRLSFIYYLSMMSTLRYYRPRAIWFHCDHLPDPNDQWWSSVWKNVPITVVHHDRWPVSTSSNVPMLSSLARRQLHLSAIAEVLVEHGGIYVDWNVLVLQSLVPLRQHDLCIGKLSDLSESIDFLSARRNSTFLRLALEGIRSRSAATHGDLIEEIRELHQKRPELLLTDPFCLSQAAQRHAGALTMMTTGDFHRQTLGIRIPHESQRAVTADSIRMLNDTYGAAMRHIYYGSSELLP